MFFNLQGTFELLMMQHQCLAQRNADVLILAEVQTHILQVERQQLDHLKHIGRRPHFFPLVNNGFESLQHPLVKRKDETESWVNVTSAI